MQYIRMTKLQATLLLLLMWLPLLLISCQKEDGDPSKGEPVYLKISVDNGFSSPATRAQGDVPSVNTDRTDGEDLIQSFAAFVFDSFTGQPVISHTADASQFSTPFVLKMETGVRDFFFVANYPQNWADDFKNNNITRDQLIRKLKAAQNYSLTYRKAGNRFPMARIYLRQTIGKGGTEQHPVPFLPVYVDPQKPLQPVSSFGAEYPDNFRPEGIHLVRACAKVSLKCSGEGVDNIEKISYRNAAQSYTFMENAGAEYGTAVPIILTLDGNKSISFYVPERLFKAGNHWDAGTDSPKDGANYLEFTMKNGTIYKLPMIHNSTYEGDYMTFAKNAAGADYNVVRNYEYRFNINVPDEKKIEVEHTVQPWQQHRSTLNFGNSTAELIPVNSPEYESADKRTLLIHGTQPAYFKLKIETPTGALWTASITNGLDFKLEPANDYSLEAGETAGTSGIVGNGTYIMKVTPTKYFIDTPRFTHIYVVVEGKEIQVAKAYMSQPPGAKNRLLIKQIE